MVAKTHLFSTAPVLRHSFATPVTNILLNTEIAVENLRAHPSALYLQRTLLNARHLQSLLRLSENPQPEIFSPQDALHELIALNEGTKLKEVLVSRLFLPPSLRLKGNKLAFQEMAVCLLNNAYESYEKRHPHRLVFVSATHEKTNFHLSVADGGRGMSWLDKTLCTTHRYSTKQNHTGLGLYFVKETATKEFRGKLDIYSQKSRGTTITLRLPLYRQPVPKASLGLNY